MSELASAVPPIRIQPANGSPVNPQGKWVLYWMISARRTRFNFALERAAEWARELRRPLLIMEALRSDYPWASDRLHRFVTQGMADNSRALDGRAAYHPYVEPERGAGGGLLAALASDAAVAVTDAFPTFFLPRMVAAAAPRLPVKLEVVDGNGLIPLRATDSERATAHSFRRFLQRNLLDHLRTVPLAQPLGRGVPKPRRLPASVLKRWPPARAHLLAGSTAALAALPIDHSVTPASDVGGARAAAKRLRRFVDRDLERYTETRNRPDDGAGSGLSPYLHFGHISAHEIFQAVTRRCGWSPDDVREPADGRRSGWWGLDENAESFLDQLVTWRELGFCFCHHRDDHARWESLPAWAQKTLSEHARDPRPHRYALEDFAAAATHDELWNAAQRELVLEGRMHNYLRMLWGKKILEWTAEPRQALEVMIELNNRYALDGRDPNSYSGIFWVLGRHDRPWGPERPIFGKVRYMSSANTRRKLPLKGYLERYGSPTP